MSTKTTLKRIALVAVSALGVGLLSVAPARATFSSALSLGYTDMTVVASAADTSNYGYVPINVIDGASALGAGRNGGLYDGETITVSVVGVPAASAVNSAPAVTDVRMATATRSDLVTWAGTGNAAETDGSYNITNASTESASNASTSTTSVYWLALSPVAAGGRTAIDAGTYTLRVRLTDSTTFTTDYTLSVRFVSSAADTGATITLAKAGDLYVGQALAFDANQYVSATLRNGNGGRIQNGSQLTTGPAAPTLAAAIVSATGTVLETLSSAPADTGVATVDHATPLSNAAGTAQAAYVDGVYGLVDTGINVASVGTTNLVRVRYGSTSATLAMNVYAAVTPIAANSTISVDATGITELNQSAGSPFTVPLTTKSAKITVVARAGVVAQANAPITFTVTWTGANAGDVAPKSATPTVVLTDASGVATLTLTNTNPLNGTTASVAFSGFTAAGQPTARVVQWYAPRVASVVQSDSVAVKFASSNVVSATVLDQFGNPVAGEILQPTITGANAPTASLPTVTTDSKGQASITVTDAKATATTKTDAVAFTTSTTNMAGVKVSGSTTLTYVTTVPTVSAMTVWYNLDETPAAGAWTPVPTTGIYADANGTKLTLPNATNMSRVITAGSATTDDLVAFQVRAGAALVPLSVTASAGAYVLNGVGLAATSRTIVTDADGYATFVGGATKAGANTFTITSGAVSATASIWTGNAAAAADARFVTLTGPETGTANGDPLSFVASVTDRFGNPISGVTMSISATGVGVIGGGATITSFTTDSTGSFTFTGTSNIAAGGSATYKVVASSPAAQFSDSAGFVGAAAVDSTLAAGNDSATATVTYAAGISASTTAANAATAAAEAAADAAAEAIDAANAATDASNLAAEAADAATVAAEEARDAADAATAAVEELATQVATLMAALKAQITTLANTVAKIAKKVKA